MLRMSWDKVMNLPCVDLDIFLSKGTSDSVIIAECKKAAEALIEHGALVLHDSRVNEEDNNRFLDLLEDYFAQPEAELRKDERPELGYQIGVTLENTEKPKCAVHEPCLRVIEKLEPSERPLDISAHQPDPKCRFFWRMSEPLPYESQFPVLNAQNVIPQTESIKQRWTPTMEQWGSAMKSAVDDLSEMVAIGLGLPAKRFREAGKYGPHLLAPTASDLKKYGNKDTILAGFHTDLNFLTIHGRSRYSGLHIWARNSGKRHAIRIPPGSSNLLVQAGKQLEHLTGGLIKAGYHEVVVNDDILSLLEKRKRDHPDRPLIRISSTFFWHLSSDFDLVTIPELAGRAKAVNSREEDEIVYESMKVGQLVSNELKHIALMA